ncbi:MAG: nucleotidyl transferase AbiEii/AbiGii toxin family protein [Nocardioidaceae bacterium]|nr:nucleotidyl transferase AbiEii/AbiGii toxin family protein [Nocardioidaceae bacterium]MCL2612139.1 nucleotidyl transferase AbiEii/AbiGii toxin family protein [Nocardioidaceae bacterium]
MFRRPHHQRIGRLLEGLDADLLAAHHCWFGGGTAIVLEHDEYRESVDVDFLVSDLSGYRQLRDVVRKDGFVGLATKDVEVARQPTADKYGIRGLLVVDGTRIKVEILHEGRIALDVPGPERAICGVRTLAPIDQVASKLLANDDRWADTSVFSRDLIDLAMMCPDGMALDGGVAKAVEAYGSSVRESLDAAVGRFRDRPHLLDSCIEALSIDAPRAAVWRDIREVADRVSAILG